MNNLPISETIIKGKAISFAQELQVKEFHASKYGLKDGGVDSMFLSKLLLKKKKQ